MRKSNNIDIETYKIKNIDNKNTVPCEEDELKKIKSIRLTVKGIY